jgi:vacuolar-type H+-ATPase catalytic subunit A/Vma1
MNETPASKGFGHQLRSRVGQCRRKQLRSLLKALEEGYRVVDVIDTAAHAGGSTVEFSKVVITVVLTISSVDHPYRHRAT